jgi:hypothetical protein
MSAHAQGWKVEVRMKWEAHKRPKASTWVPSVSVNIGIVCQWYLCLFSWFEMIQDCRYGCEHEGHEDKGSCVNKYLMPPNPYDQWPARVRWGKIRYILNSLDMFIDELFLGRGISCCWLINRRAKVVSDRALRQGLKKNCDSRTVGGRTGSVEITGTTVVERYW